MRQAPGGAEGGRGQGRHGRDQGGIVGCKRPRHTGCCLSSYQEGAHMARWRPVLRGPCGLPGLHVGFCVCGSCANPNPTQVLARNPNPTPNPIRSKSLSRASLLDALISTLRQRSTPGSSALSPSSSESPPPFATPPSPRWRSTALPFAASPSPRIGCR